MVHILIYLMKSAVHVHYQDWPMFRPCIHMPQCTPFHRHYASKFPCTPHYKTQKSEPGSTCTHTPQRMPYLLRRGNRSVRSPCCRDSWSRQRRDRWLSIHKLRHIPFHRHYANKFPCTLRCRSRTKMDSTCIHTLQHMPFLHHYEGKCPGTRCCTSMTRRSGLKCWSDLGPTCIRMPRHMPYRLRHGNKSVRSPYCTS